MRPNRSLVFTILMVTTLSIALAGCDPSPDAASPAGQGETATTGANGDTADVFISLDSPAGPGSGKPSLFTTDDGRVLMSWLEPVGNFDAEPASTRRGRFALRFATFEGDTWSAPRTIAESEDFFVNWADFPVIIESGGMLVSHWLEMNGGRGTSYDIHITRSLDGGETWTESIIPHHDGTPTEHGFVSMVPEADGGFTAVWLDGRAFADSSEGAVREMSLRGTRFAADGTQEDVELLDPRICECCQTSAAYVGGNLVAVYRDRSDSEVREMYAVRRTADGWQEPVRVSHDNWQIRACPVNGPAIVGGETNGAVAWYSLREGVPEVKVAFSRDGGEHFLAPILLDRGPANEMDDGNPRQLGAPDGADDQSPPIPMGRVAIARVSPSQVAVSWIAAKGNSADIIIQTVDLDGTLGERLTIASTSSARASGFPRIARSGERLIIAWTEPSASPSLRTAAIPLPLH